MSQKPHAINRYKADLRELEFVLFEQFRYQELLGKPPYDAWGKDEIVQVLQECYRFVTEVLGPLNSVSIPLQWAGLHNQIARMPPVTPAISPYPAVFRSSITRHPDQQSPLSLLNFGMATPRSRKETWSVVVARRHDVPPPP